MTEKIRFIAVFIFCFISSFVFYSSCLAQTTPDHNICTLVQCVKIQNGYLEVLSSDNKTYVPFFIRGVAYEPTPIGRYISDWGYPELPNGASDPRSGNNNIYDDPNILTRDFRLLQQMNANTIRIYQGNDIQVSCLCTNNTRFPDYMTNAGNTVNANKALNTLDLADNYGLKVIAGFLVGTLTFDANNTIGSIDSNNNLLTRQDIINNFVAFVNNFKGNRAVLFWAIGNENNYQVLNAGKISITAFENAFGISKGDEIYNWLQQTASFLDFDNDIIVDLNSSYVLNKIKSQYPSDYSSILNILKQFSGQNLNPQQLAAWYSLVDAMALAAHKAEGNTFHPVAVVNGYITEIGNSTDGASDHDLPDLDIWGANVYTGQSFGTVFKDYAAKSSKPLWISEYGVDAYNTTSINGINNWGSTAASDLGGSGSADPMDQSNWDVGLWNQIFNNSPATIGGTLFEYSDEWWKSYEFYCTTPNPNNNPAIQAENVISATICNSTHKYFGFPETWSPDNFSNEEWFGIMSISSNNNGTTINGQPDVMTPRSVYSDLKAQWQSNPNPWPTITLNISGLGAGSISSPVSFLGAGLNCTYSSGASTGTCSTTVANNQPVSLNFASNNNSIVTNWGVSGCTSGTASCQFIADTSINISVTVTPSYQMTIIAGNNGSISPTKATITNGGSQKFTLTPDTGYTPHLSIDGIEVALNKNNKYNLLDVTSTHIITASFILNTYTMNISAGSNGSISPTSSTISYGGSQKFTLTPNTGYDPHLSIDGHEVALNKNNKYNLLDVTSTYTIAASFTLKTYAMIISAGKHGSISPISSSIPYGGSQKFTLTPKPGYSAHLSIDGQGVTLNKNNKYNLIDVKSIHSITATFTKP